MVNGAKKGEISGGGNGPGKEIVNNNFIENDRRTKDPVVQLFYVKETVL